MTYIYIMARLGSDNLAQSPIKVGISSDPEKRLKGIQTSCPFKVCLFTQLDTPARQLAEHFERAFHEVNGQHRVNGEWFDFEPMRAACHLCGYFRQHLSTVVPTESVHLIPELLERAGVLRLEEFLRMAERSDREIARLRADLDQFKLDLDN